MKPRTLVIVPAFNEEASIAPVVSAVGRAAPYADVCVVDDGSTDSTAREAAGAGATVLRVPLNLGIGGAVQAGYLWARDHGYDAAVQVDGDGQHDPAFVEALLSPLVDGGADVVIGSRFIEREGFQSTPIRRAGIRYLSALLRVLSGARVSDPTSGFRAVNRRGIELFARAYPSDYPEPGSVAMAVRERLRICEIPVRMRQRAQGQSSIGLLRSLYYGVKVSLELLFQAIPRPRATVGREERS